MLTCFTERVLIALTYWPVPQLMLVCNMQHMIYVGSDVAVRLEKMRVGSKRWNLGLLCLLWIPNRRKCQFDSEEEAKTEFRTATTCTYRPDPTQLVTPSLFIVCPWNICYPSTIVRTTSVNKYQSFIFLAVRLFVNCNQKIIKRPICKGNSINFHIMHRAFSLQAFGNSYVCLSR